MHRVVLVWHRLGTARGQRLETLSPKLETPLPPGSEVSFTQFHFLRTDQVTLNPTPESLNRLRKRLPAGSPKLPHQFAQTNYFGAVTWSPGMGP